MTPRKGRVQRGACVALLALGLAVLLGALAVRAAPAQAQAATPPSPVTADEVNHVAKQLFCPVCENTPLDVCPTEACAQWRNTIREKLVAGWSEQQILDYFVEQYGERVLARPSTRGLNLLVWVVPPLAVLLGAFGLWRYLQGAVRKPAPAEAETPAAPAPGDEYAQRLERELKQRL
jgi:cytochrome c-type biogenesis protein CcmH